MIKSKKFLRNILSYIHKIITKFKIVNYRNEKYRLLIMT